MNLSTPQTLIMAAEGVEPWVKMRLPSITIVIVTHKMQQAVGVSDFSAFLKVDHDHSGSVVEIGPTEQIFTNPKNQQIEDDVTGRFG
jgi:phosphate transport system ATP-binding protein